MTRTMTAIISPQPRTGLLVVGGVAWVVATFLLAVLMFVVGGLW